MNSAIRNPKSKIEGLYPFTLHLAFETRRSTHSSNINMFKNKFISKERPFLCARFFLISVLPFDRIQLTVQLRSSVSFNQVSSDIHISCWYTDTKNSSENCLAFDAQRNCYGTVRSAPIKNQCGSVGFTSHRDHRDHREFKSLIKNSLSTLRDRVKTGHQPCFLRPEARRLMPKTSDMTRSFPSWVGNHTFNFSPSPLLPPMNQIFATNQPRPAFPTDMM